MKHKKLSVAAIVIYVAIVVALYVIIYVVPSITGALTKTSIVKYGEMRTEKEYDGVIVRNEQVYVAERDGSVSYYVENNTKTRKGIKILDIYSSAGNSSITCPNTGVVSYYYDGYESAMTVDTASQVPSLLKDAEGNDIVIEVQNIENGQAQVGHPLYKLITGDTWSTVVVVPNEDITQMGYEEGMKVTLEFETGSVSASISEIVIGETESTVVVSTAKYYKDYDKLRQCKVNLVLKDSKGLIVPNTAIAYEDGKPGVYVKGIDGEYDFNRIKIINSDVNDSVVYADTFSELRSDGLTDTIQTISIYDEILKNAEEYNPGIIE